MKVSFVEASSLRENLKNLFLNCNELDVAVAYVKIRGLETFLDLLEQSTLLKEEKPIRIVFGMSPFQGITDKESAKRLLELSQKYKNVAVKMWDDPRFHPKLMIFHGDPDRIMVGSSNLTGGAQSRNAEANVFVEDPEREFMKDATKFFETCFNDAPQLEQGHIDRYTPPSHVRTGSGKHPPSPVSNWPFRSGHSPISRKHGDERGAHKWTAHQTIRYYDQVIANLEKKKKLTLREKRSLAAFRANRTRTLAYSNKRKSAR